MGGHVEKVGGPFCIVLGPKQGHVICGPVGKIPVHIIHLEN
jgi:hypothetical protein